MKGLGEVTKEELDNYKSFEAALSYESLELLQLTKRLLSEFRAAVPSKRFRQRAYFDCLKVLVSNIAFCQIISSDLYLMIGLDNNLYSKLPSTLNPYAISAKVLGNLIDWLVKANYLSKRGGYKGTRIKRRTRLKATELLITELSSERVCKAMLTTSPPKHVIILKDDDKNIISTPRNTKKSLSETLIKLNKLMETIEVVGPNGRLPPQYFVRIFNDSSFKKGGRFYGAGIQNLPKSVRARLVINGSPVVERDYSGLHAMILYGRLGIDYSGDPYCVDIFDRETAKFAFLVMLNAKRKQSAISAIVEETTLNHVQSKSLVGKLEERHSELSHCFYRCEAKNLQFMDSQITEVIIKTFIERGYPVIPVHDSYIVEEHHLSLLDETMMYAYRHVMGNPNLSIAIK